MIALLAAAAHAGTYRPFSFELRGSYFVADAFGVPDASRVGATLEVRALHLGPFVVGGGIPFVYGHSESAGFSYRLGLQAEIARPFEAGGFAPYLSAGVHYLVSEGWDEVRFGPSWRVALGMRLFGDGHWELAIEPLTLERLPDGPGPHTPLRSRWGWDLVFLAVGVTW